MTETNNLTTEQINDELTTHPQVFISDGAICADVDEGIADLILELWRAGIDTYLSCQNDPSGRVWIDMPIQAAKSFLTIAARPFDDDMESICNRSVGQSAPDDFERYLTERAWHYAVRPWNCSEDEGTVDVEADFSVRFPQTDYDEVLRRFRVHNIEKDTESEILVLWNQLPDSEPSPVKVIAKALNLPNAHVAVVVYPPPGVCSAPGCQNPVDGFADWDDSQEPDL
jgi:hypothetical protein